MLYVDGPFGLLVPLPMLLHKGFPTGGIQKNVAAVSYDNFFEISYTCYGMFTSSYDALQVITFLHKNRTELAILILSLCISEGAMLTAPSTLFCVYSKSSSHAHIC